MVCEQSTRFWNDHLKTRQEQFESTMSGNELKDVDIGALVAGRRMIWNIIQFYTGTEKLVARCFPSRI